MHPHASRDYIVITLLLVLASAIFVTAAPDGNGAHLVTIGMLGLMLVSAVTAAGAGRRTQTAAAGLAGAALLAGLIGALADETFALPRIISAVLVALTPVALVRAALTEVRAFGVSVRTIMVAVAIYMLIGMLFAMVICTIATLNDAEYFGEMGDGTLAENMYFSFVTLATLGYGDFTPATGVGRSLAMFEGVLGQLYLVTVVSLLIGNVRRPADRAPVSRS